MRNIIFSNKNPSLIHSSSHEIYDLFEECKVNIFANNNKSFQNDSELEIITVNSYLIPGLFERCCNHLDIRCNNLYNSKKDSFSHNLSKLEIILNHIQEINKPYILFADSFDVLLLEDPQVIKEKYLKFNKEIVFSTQIDPYPIHVNTEDLLFNNIGRYLNSGLYIGKKESIKFLFTKLLNKKLEKINDQQLIRTFLPEFTDIISLDFEEKLFFTFWKNSCNLGKIV